jgi:hypothetical protein
MKGLAVLIINYLGNPITWIQAKFSDEQCFLKIYYITVCIYFMGEVAVVDME